MSLRPGGVFFLLLLATVVPGTAPGLPQKEFHAPVLINTCLISQNVPRLVAFYSRVLGAPARTVGGEYAEFHTGIGVLAIFSAEAQEKYIPKSTQPGVNRSLILEFEVTDVDEQFARLQNIINDWVKPATNQPWGTRSIYFRDPDGNLVDFFARIAHTGHDDKRGNSPDNAAASLHPRSPVFYVMADNVGAAVDSIVANGGTKAHNYRIP